MIEYNREAASLVLDVVAKSAFELQARRHLDSLATQPALELVLSELYRRAFHAGASFAWHSMACMGKDVAAQIGKSFPENPEVAKMAAQLQAEVTVERAAAKDNL